MPTVLIVEDDHDTRVALRDVLEAEGFTVLSAANGRDGFEILEKLQIPVVVLLDQNMSVASGDDFMHRMRANERLANVPVIAVSAVGDRLRRLGAVAFVKKPLNFPKLVELIRNYIPNSFCKSTSSG
jgi:two-component system chemotaxis sensor kinase CheA